MLRVGLTGGIGSGKSSVSALFVERGAVLVDSDLNARVVVAKGTRGLAAIVDAFGDGILQADGELDRAALGRLVFADPEQLARLNAIVHPLVGELSQQQIDEAQRAGAKVLLHDVPLLVENNLQGLYDAVVVVAASPETQLERLTQQRHMTPEDARARIEAQLPLAEKLKTATYVIDNDGSRDALVSQVDRVWDALLTAAEGSER